MSAIAFLPVDPVVFAGVDNLRPVGVKKYRFAFRDGREYQKFAVAQGYVPSEEWDRVTRFQEPNTVIVVHERVPEKAIYDTDKIVFLFTSAEAQAKYLSALQQYTGVEAWVINSV